MTHSSYLASFKGYLKGMPKWHHLDTLWSNLRNTEHNDWYIYAVGDTPPANTVPKDKLLQFIGEIDKLLHQEHQEDYCGIVYADSVETPSFIKIYDERHEKYWRMK